MPDAEKLFQELPHERENNDQQREKKVIGKAKKLIEQTSIELPAESSTERKEQPAIKPMALKLSVSLYERGMDSLDNIREFLRGHGVRKLTDSKAIRITIGAAITEAKLIEIHHQLKTDDKRCKHHQEKDHLHFLDGDVFMSV